MKVLQRDFELPRAPQSFRIGALCLVIGFVSGWWFARPRPIELYTEDMKDSAASLRLRDELDASRIPYRLRHGTRDRWKAKRPSP
ncbi:MAG: hypothetical protein ACO1SV_12190 [Fimbriimonas sp.]